MHKSCENYSRSFIVEPLLREVLDYRAVWRRETSSSFSFIKGLSCFQKGNLCLFPRPEIQSLNFAYDLANKINLFILFKSLLLLLSFAMLFSGYHLNLRCLISHKCKYQKTPAHSCSHNVVKGLLSYFINTRRM